MLVDNAIQSNQLGLTELGYLKYCSIVPNHSAIYVLLRGSILKMPRRSIYGRLDIALTHLVKPRCTHSVDG